MKNYTFVDYATQGYIALTGALILLFHGQSVPQWLWLVLAHGVGVILVHGLIQFASSRPSNRPLGFLRAFYPLLLFSAFYCETGHINKMFFKEFLDPGFYRAEQWVWGFQPSLAWMDRLPYLPVSELLYASYFSYYFMIMGVGITLLIRNREHFYHYVSIVAFLFYVCYFCYIFLPVVGPPIWYEPVPDYLLAPGARPEVILPFPESVQSGLFYNIMAFIYRNFETPGAAFPSSHVAVAICTVYFSFLYLRRIRYPHLVVAVLLCIATVYCRYHFAIDVLAGILTAFICIPTGNFLYRRFHRALDEPENNCRAGK